MWFLSNSLMKNMIYANFEITMKLQILCIMLWLIYSVYHSLPIFLWISIHLTIKSQNLHIISLNLVQFSWNSRIKCLIYAHFLIPIYNATVSILMFKSAYYANNINILSSFDVLYHVCYKTSYFILLTNLWVSCVITWSFLRVCYFILRYIVARTWLCDSWR